MRRKTLYLGLVVLALVALVGCAKPPQELVNSVQTAIDGVKQAGAEMYAPDALAKVTDLFSQAQAEIETQNGKFALFRSYKKAEEVLKQALPPPIPRSRRPSPTRRRRSRKRPR